MKDEPASKRDRLIREDEFERAGGVDISAFLEPGAELTKEKGERKAGAERIDAPRDDAVGDLIEPFFSAESMASAGRRDGAVLEARQDDVVTQLSVEGEKKLHWTLMVAMIGVYTLIGVLLGTTVDPLIGVIGLLTLSTYGFWLGARWIPRRGMHVLGVTWVIISMKLLYGLAIDLHHWGWLAGLPLHADAVLGLLLLLLVGLNVFVAHHHDSDAVAVQSTLVLMAVASGAGAASDLGVDPEIVLAMLLLTATCLLHGLALMRGSGNLAAVGVVASNLWIGMHALSSGWVVFGLELLTFEDPLLLFLLFTAVNVINAAASARFYAEDNWFSQACSALGIGRPGLWGVSVGIGMLGALMTISAHREQTGYALAQITVLLAAFGGSYLVVRKVEVRRLHRTMIIPGPLLVLALLVLEASAPDGVISGFANYSLFAIGAAAICAITLLRHQTAVSDAVLWIGCCAVVILLTLLVPAGEDGDGGLRMLLGVFGSFAGLAVLAIKRRSPSLGGVSIIGPWIWCLFFATDVDARLVGADVIPIVLDPWFITGFCVLNTMIQLPVNTLLGGSGINLGSRFKGLTELSAFSRDSGSLRLWNLSYGIGLLGWMAMARPQAMAAEGLVLGIVTLIGIHVYSEATGRHMGTPGFLLKAFIVTALILQFRFGLDGIWPLLIAACGGLLFRFSSAGGEDVLTTTMLGLAASATLFALFAEGDVLAVDLWWPDDIAEASLHLLAAVMMLGLYLPRAGRFDEILRPAVASSVMLIAIIGLASSHSAWLQLASFLVFLTTGVLLVMQAEVRGGIRDIARRETRMEEVRRKQLVKEHLEGGGRIDDLGDDAADRRDGDRGTMRVVDPELIALLDKRRTSKRRSAATGSEEEILLGDVRYRPVVMLVFLAAVFALTGYYSISTVFGGGGDVADAMLVIAALTALVLVSASRWRASGLGLELPDVLGIEMPLAATMVGLTFVYLLGRIVGEMDDQLGLALLATMLAMFAGFALWGRSDLGLRIPSALEWIAYCLAGSSIVGLVLFAATPPPIFTDPLRYDGWEYIGPLAFQELLLLGMVIGWDAIDGMRLSRSMSDHRGVSGRVLWLLMVVSLSSGLAALLASGMAARRALGWTQPALMCTAVIAAFFTLYASAVWIGSDLVGVVAAIGILGAAGCAAGTLWISLDAARDASWTTCWVWDAHLLGLISTAMLAATLGGLAIPAFVLMLLFLSCMVWVAGIQQDRRTFRVWGAIDLAASWAISVLYIEVMLEPLTAITMLAATAIVLGIVTWLAQSQEDVLGGDASAAHSLREDVAEA